jgi:general secretion pathway protein K
MSGNRQRRPLGARASRPLFDRGTADPSAPMSKAGETPAVPGPSDPRRGMILLTVLWTIALMSALAMAAAVSFRGFAGVAGVGRDRVQGDGLLTAGLEMTAGTVTSLGDKPLTEREITIDLSTGSVRARFSDEGGRIDVAKAPAAVLASLLRFVGAPEQEAQGVAQRIIEWRRRNATPPADAGAPASNQPAKKLDTEQPFADIGEVAQVPGMAPAWLGAMAPLTTVFGSETVNPLTASPRVIAALPGVSRVQLEAFLAARRSSATDAERLIAMFGAGQSYLAAKPQRVVSVELEAALPDGYSAAAHAVIVVLPQDSQPYRVLVWKPLPSSR